MGQSYVCWYCTSTQICWHGIFLMTQQKETNLCRVHSNSPWCRYSSGNLHVYSRFKQWLWRDKQIDACQLWIIRFMWINCFCLNFRSRTRSRSPAEEEEEERSAQQPTKARVSLWTNPAGHSWQLTRRVRVETAGDGWDDRWRWRGWVMVETAGEGWEGGWWLRRRGWWLRGWVMVETAGVSTSAGGVKNTLSHTDWIFMEMNMPWSISYIICTFW